MSPAFEIVLGHVRCLIEEEDIRRDFELLRRRPSSLAAPPVAEAILHSGSPCPRLLGIFAATGYVHGALGPKRFHWQCRLRVSTPHHASAEKRLLDYREGRDARLDKAVRRLGCSLFDALRLNSALQSAVHFRPIVARDLAEMYQARRCLDFSAGWGDRLAGFLASSCVRTIHLVEPRADAAPGYEQQVHAVPHDKVVVVHRGAAEDVLPELGGPFDLVLSSPPYFNLEIYDADDPQQVSQRYASTAEYLEGFLIPVARRSVELLAPGGVLCVNVADNARCGVVFCAAFLEAMRGHARLVGTYCYATRRNPGSRNRDDLHGEPIYVFAAGSEI